MPLIRLRRRRSGAPALAGRVLSVGADAARRSPAGAPVSALRVTPPRAGWRGPRCHSWVAPRSHNGTVATFHAAGDLVVRVAPPRCASFAAYSLHAGVDFKASDRAGLERLCRYILRPPLAKGPSGGGRMPRLFCGVP